MQQSKKAPVASTGAHKETAKGAAFETGKSYPNAPAFASDTPAAAQLEAYTAFVEQSAPAPLQGEEARPPLRVVDLSELLTLEIPKREHVLYPIIPAQGLCMVFAERGVGKTHFALGLAYAVATGGKLFDWEAPKARRVLYIDGEMPVATMQERLAAIVTQDPRPNEFDPSFLRTITPDLQEGDRLMPNLAQTVGQVDVEPFLEGVELVVIDNLATLARAGRSNEEESWTPVQTWILGLRRRGISVLLVHHSNKSGNQRGTSAKEDVLDTVIQLRHPADYEFEQGARFEVHLTKARGVFGVDAEPFEAQLVNGAWTAQPLRLAIVEKVKSLAEEGLTQREIAEELAVSKGTVSRLCRANDIVTKGGRR